MALERGDRPIRVQQISGMKGLKRRRKITVNIVQCLCQVGEGEHIFIVTLSAVGGGKSREVLIEIDVYVVVDVSKRPVYELWDGRSRASGSSNLFVRHVD